MARKDSEAMWPCDGWNERELTPDERARLEATQSKPEVGSFERMREALRSDRFDVTPSDLKRDEPETAHGRIAQQSKAIVSLVENGWISHSVGYKRLQELAEAQTRIGEQALKSLDVKIQAAKRSERNDKAKRLLRTRKQRRQERDRIRRANRKLVEDCSFVFGGIGQSGYVKRYDVRPDGRVTRSAREKRVGWLLSTLSSSCRVDSGAVVGSTHPHACGNVYAVSTAWESGFNGGTCLHVAFGRECRRRFKFNFADFRASDSPRITRVGAHSWPTVEPPRDVESRTALVGSIDNVLRAIERGSVKFVRIVWGLLHLYPAYSSRSFHGRCQQQGSPRFRLRQ